MNKLLAVIAISLLSGCASVPNSAVTSIQPAAVGEPKVVIKKTGNTIHIYTQK